MLLLPLFVVCARRDVHRNTQRVICPPTDRIQTTDHGAAKTGDKGKLQEPVKKVEKVPNIADIIPLATQLTARAAALKNNLKVVPESEGNAEARRRNPRETEAPVLQIGKAEGCGKAPTYQTLLAIKQAIRRESDLLQESDDPLKEAIIRLQSFRKEWFVDKKRWNTMARINHEGRRC